MRFLGFVVEIAHVKPLSSHARKIGGKWKLPVLYLLYKRPARFNKIKQLLKPISSMMLTKSLKELEDDNLIHKKDEVRYSLTTSGKDVVVLMLELENVLKRL